jgi:CRP-like cAMP-binding protein
LVPTQNLLLASLPEDDLNLIRPHLRKSFFDQRTVLYESGNEVASVYFPTSAIVSLVVMLSSGQVIEAAMVGRDGVVGASAALDGRISLNRAIVQIAGEMMACDVDALRNAALKHQTFLSILIRHEQTVYTQAQQSAACNASHLVEARLCRWMLRARDLSGSDTLPFTQEFLAEMLGVTRPTVSMVAHTLQKAGLIKYTRGRIQIVDLEGLRESSCECYGTVRAFYETLIGKYPKI